jgi:hypothetical protein
MRSLLLTLVCLLFSGPARGTTWYVHPGGAGDAVTIQAGVDLAQAGDTVLVAPATYTDTVHVWIEGEEKVANVHLSEEIVLVAEGDTSNTVILGEESDVAIFVDGVGSGGVIEGFRIKTQFIPFGCAAGFMADLSGPPPGYRVGIWCEDASIVIRGNAISNHGVAMVLRRSAATIEANEISWTIDGVMCEEGSDAVIMLNQLVWIGIAVTATHSSPTIVDNSFGGKGQMCSGIDCNEGGDAYIARNRFDNIRPETVIVGPAAPIIEENFFTNGSTAIGMSSGAAVPVIRNNVFYDHGSWVFDIQSGNAIIENNTIDVGATRAFALQGGASPLIRNNIITRVPIGVRCILGAAPTFECNNFYDVQIKYLDDCPDQTGLNGNISENPQFCGVWDSGNWELQSDSPCAPGNHPDGYACGRIGAKGVGCSVTPTRRTSLGELKARFEQKEEKR